MGILVVPYDEAWPLQFEALKQRYEVALVDTPVLSIEHVGSTSVPGLCAKPIIDVDIIVAAENCQDAISALVKYGYEFEGDLGIEGRWAFKSVGAQYPTHTYITRNDSLALKNHLTVRNVLRGNSELREEYCALKLLLASQTSNIDTYIRGKTKILRRILKLGGFTDEEVDDIARVNNGAHNRPR